MRAWSDGSEKHLKVEVNREKSGSGPSDRSSLLGFRLQPDGRIGIAPKAITRLKDKVRELWEARQSLTSEQLRDQWRRYIRGWWNYFKLADWRREVTDLSGWIRRHMRKCFWLRWKTPRGRYNALKRLGVAKRSLGNAWSAKGAWPMARHYVMQHALRNQTLRQYGFMTTAGFNRRMRKTARPVVWRWCGRVTGRNPRDPIRSLGSLQLRGEGREC